MHREFEMTAEDAAVDYANIVSEAGNTVGYINGSRPRPAGLSTEVLSVGGGLVADVLVFELGDSDPSTDVAQDMLQSLHDDRQQAAVFSDSDSSALVEFVARCNAVLN